MGECNGVRVCEITEKTNLSRPAVSHHLSILKDAGLVKMRREGTKNFYYFDADQEAMNKLLNMLNHASNVSGDTPNWFKEGVELALLAPTAMNQQKFEFIYNNGKVTAKAGAGFYSKVDLGIVKYHFEIGANRKIF